MTRLLSGVELTARFFEACEREVVERHPGTYWIQLTEEDGWKREVKVRDLTEPGHLEQVIGMVRQRWPHYDIGWKRVELDEANGFYYAVTFMPDWGSDTNRQALSDSNLCRAIMECAVAACRAAGVAVE